MATLKNLTEEQALSIINEAKVRRPQLNVEEAKQLLLDADARVASTGQQAQPTMSQRIGRGVQSLLGGSAIASTIGAASTAPFVASQATSTNELTNTALSYMRMARTEQDPAKRASYLNKAKSILQGSSAPLDESMDQAMRVGNISEKDLSRSNMDFTLRRSLAAGLEGASFATPGPVGITARDRIASAAFRGGASGTLGGASQALLESDDPEQAAKRIAVSTGVGAASGAVLESASSFFNGIKESLANKEIKIERREALLKDLSEAEQMIRRAENPEELADALGSGWIAAYQSQFPISRKGYAVERLQPNKTIADMMEYNVVGTPGQIRQKIKGMAGPDSVPGQLVNEFIDQKKNVDIPLPDIDEQELLDRMTGLEKSDLKQIMDRFLRTKTGKQILTLDAKSLIRLERDLIKEGYSTLKRGKGSDDIRNKILGETKLIVADKISEAIDDAFGNITIPDNVRLPLVDWIEQTYSPALAKEFSSIRTLSQLRRIQRSFVRMDQIMDLSEDVASSLGQNYFQMFSNIAVVSRALPALARTLDPITISVVTNASKNAAMTQRNLGNFLGPLLERQISPAMNISNVAQQGLKTATSGIPPMVQALNRYMTRQQEEQQQRKRLPGR